MCKGAATICNWGQSPRCDVSGPTVGNCEGFSWQAFGENLPSVYSLEGVTVRLTSPQAGQARLQLQSSSRCLSSEASLSRDPFPAPDSVLFHSLSSAHPTPGLPWLGHDRPICANTSHPAWSCSGRENETLREPVLFPVCLLITLSPWVNKALTINLCLARCLNWP